jgi:DNA-binding CsgD family transcriptional regulator
VATIERAAEVSLILGSAASREAGAQEALVAMRAIVPYVGIAMCTWDPVARSHRAFVNEGYPDAVMDYLCRDYFALDAGYHHILAGPRESTRWHDIPIDYEQTYSVEAVFGPAGYREGLTARLTTRDGRLTGALHVSTDVAEHPSDLAQDAIEWLVPALAAACDVLRDPADLVASLEPGANAAVVSLRGTATALPGRDRCPWLRPDGELVALALRLLRGGCRERRFLWEDDSGGWHRVHLLSVTAHPGMAVLCETAIARVPHELTARELEILTLMTAGLSNRAIAERLTVAQRTVATHVEHVFEKLASHTRTGCAALAIEEGLLREPLSDS